MAQKPRRRTPERATQSTTKDEQEGGKRKCIFMQKPEGEMNIYTASTSRESNICEQPPVRPQIREF